MDLAALMSLSSGLTTASEAGVTEEDPEVQGGPTAAKQSPLGSQLTLALRKESRGTKW